MVVGEVGRRRAVIKVEPPPEHVWALGERLVAQCRRGQTPAVVMGDLTLVRPLGWRDIPVIAVSTQAGDVTFRSRYVGGHCWVPGFLRGDQAKTVEILCALGETLEAIGGKRLPLLYGGDDQLELIYRHQAVLERQFLFLLNQPDLGWALHDKGRFASLCEEVGVRIPATVVPAHTRFAADEIAALRPPILIKPRTKSDWKTIQQVLFRTEAKAGVFTNATELLRHPGYPGLADRLVVQEYIQAPVTRLYSFHGFATEQGQLLGAFSGHKLRTYPEIAGESALLELVRNDEVERAGRNVVHRLGVRGPFKVDFIEEPRTRELLTLEVNARFTLWHHLGAAHGVNLPAIAYDYLLNGRVPDPASDYMPRLRWINFYRDLHAFREKHPTSALHWLLTILAWPTLHETFAWNDPAPFWGWLRSMVRARRQRRTGWLHTA
jgi:D-aspartate ligase